MTYSLSRKRFLLTIKSWTIFLHEEFLEQAKLRASINYTVLSLFCLNLVEFILLFRFFLRLKGPKNFYFNILDYSEPLFNDIVPSIHSFPF